MREWLSKLDESGEDFTISVSSRRARTPAVELVLSPRNGLVLATKDAGQETAAREEYAVVLKAGQVGLYSPIGGRKLLLAHLKEQLRAFLSIDPKRGDTNRNQFALTLGAGITHQPESTPASAAYRFELTLPPAACLSFFSGEKSSSWFEGDVLIRSNATMLLKLSASTGRIIELRQNTGDGDSLVESTSSRGRSSRRRGGSRRRLLACRTLATLTRR